MPFHIPESAETPLVEFAKLRQEEAAQLIEAVRTSTPALGIDKFAIRVASKSGLDLDLVGRILSTFAGMHLARVDAGKTLEDFVSDLSGAMKKRGDKELTPVNWESFAASVRAILGCEESLGVTAKALDLLTDHEHCLHSCGIITDVRHIFPADATQPSKAAVIVHMLNLVWHEISGMKEIYVALDASDLNKLRLTIERAEAKEANLRKTMKQCGVDLLDD